MLNSFTISEQKRPIFQALTILVVYQPSSDTSTPQKIATFLQTNVLFDMHNLSLVDLAKSPQIRKTSHFITLAEFALYEAKCLQTNNNRSTNFRSKKTLIPKKKKKIVILELNRFVVYFSI